MQWRLPQCVCRCSFCSTQGWLPKRPSPAGAACGSLVLRQHSTTRHGCRKPSPRACLGVALGAGALDEARKVLLNLGRWQVWEGRAGVNTAGPAVCNGSCLQLLVAV